MNYKKLTIILIILEIMLFTAFYYYIILTCWNYEEMTVNYCVNYIANKYISNFFLYTWRILWLALIISIYKLIKNKLWKYIKKK